MRGEHLWVAVGGRRRWVVCLNPLDPLMLAFAASALATSTALGMIAFHLGRIAGRLDDREKVEEFARSLDGKAERAHVKRPL